MLSKPVFSWDEVLAAVVLVLVVGSLVLAIIDPNTRPAFTDLTEVAVGATKTKVMLDALAYYLGCTDDVPLVRRVIEMEERLAALEAKSEK